MIRKLLLLPFLILISFAEARTEQCFLLSVDKTFSTKPSERVCLEEIDAKTQMHDVKFYWGKDLVGEFKLILLASQVVQKPKRIFRTFGVSTLFTPALNLFSFQMTGDVDDSGKEVGVLVLGNQLKRPQLNYRSE